VRRRRTLRRTVPLAALALVALVAGIVVGATHSSPEQRLAERWGSAWERHDYAAMYRLLSDSARRRVSAAGFAAAYRRAEATATVTKIEAGKAGDKNDAGVSLPVTATTRVWGELRAPVVVPFSGDGDSARVDWSPELTFPGLRRDERLARRTTLPRRAGILARDGTTLAKGADRVSRLPSATAIVGELGPPTRARGAALYALGYPPGAAVGISGLERVFETQIAGTPGGVLLAGSRVLARSRPRAGRPARSTIDPRLQTAAVNALGSQDGGVAVLDPRNGQVLGLAGIAFSALQPPGSTMKVITTTAALEAGDVRLRSRFPVQTSSVVGGQTIANAGGEACGGDFKTAFAESCNSVFAPLGVKVGGQRLVATAERFGFNKPTGIPGAAVNTIPPAAKMVGDNEVGSSAIGQGLVQATPLGMAAMAAAIANAGVYVRPTLVKGARTPRVRAAPRRVAAQVRRLMLGVVAFGTGKAAQIPGVKVAGKTGTAELGGGLQDDGWFVAFAPARRPTVAVGVLVVQAGFGGDVAAPIAKQVLEAGLGRGRG
jgi:cell division protein FtsI/penicillin-binding protein 2